MKFVQKFNEILKDYCLNCSLAGLSYIADNRYHYTERLFWLVCIIISWAGSYHLINVTMNTIDDYSISMVVEGLRPLDVTNFPSIAVCELGYGKDIYPRLVDLIENMKEDEDWEYNYDVEDFMLRVIFHNLYNYGSITSYCDPFKDCTDCIKCPSKGYPEFANIVRAKCSQLFSNCVWNGVPFDCCTYLKPLNTSYGKCFLLNSIQVVEKYSANWLPMKVGGTHGNGMLQIDTNQPTSLSVLNEEDLPHILLHFTSFSQVPKGSETIISVRIQNTINDPGVRDINQVARKCLFPDEPFDTSYKYYSYSACVTECLKRIQLKTCNCTHYNMIFDETDKTPACEYEGLYCLDQNSLISPQTAMMQPWRTNGLYCHCLPSCTEHEIKLVGSSESVNPDKEERSYYVSLQALPTQRYRRQAVKEFLDMVVSIAGIMGLFMGASILSLVELIYFFTVRVWGTAYMKKSDPEMKK